MKSRTGRFVPALFLSTAVFTGMSVPAHSDVKVAVTIKPLHSLVSAIMQGAGKPELIMPGTASPHTYTLAPSRASMLQKADVVFQIANSFETSLTPAINKIATNALKVNFEGVEGLKLFKFRSPHHHHDHADHDKKEKHDDHEKHADHAGHDKKDNHHHHDDHDIDWHIWLGLQNASVMATHITKTLAKADPENAALYSKNNADLQKKMKTLKTDTAGRLTGLKGKHYVVFHDGYQYFEKTFGLSRPGVVNVNPQTPSSAGHLSKLYKYIKDKKVVCVFTEPQFNQKLVAAIVKKTGIKSATLDPLGANIKQGPELYFKLIKNLATQLSSCLKS